MNTRALIIIAILTGCGPSEDIPPHTFTPEQKAVVDAMPAEQAIYMRECYEGNRYYTFRTCLEEKQKYYGPAPVVQQESSNLGTGIALGYVLGSSSSSSSSARNYSTPAPRPSASPSTSRSFSGGGRR